MASVWEEGTRVIIRRGQYSGFGGTVTAIFSEDPAPIVVEITGGNTSRRSYTPDELDVVPQPVKRTELRRYAR